MTLPHLRYDHLKIIPSEWEKKKANEATDKQLISKIYKQLPAAQVQKNKRPNQKMGQRTK